jgi:hypothetical protein
LVLLWAIDSEYPDRDYVAERLDGDRIAVYHPDHAAGERLCGERSKR